MPQDTDVRYAYQYDSYGNWTEKVMTRDDGSSSSVARPAEAPPLGIIRSLGVLPPGHRRSAYPSCRSSSVMGIGVGI